MGHPFYSLLHSSKKIFNEQVGKQTGLASSLPPKSNQNASNKQ